ncbi:hypothetical protein KKD37_01220 [Patescibacteria group bacterium]|nr:hypothetical protein [Patescibacteria group bacterium]
MAYRRGHESAPESGWEISSQKKLGEITAKIPGEDLVHLSKINPFLRSDFKKLSPLGEYVERARFGIGRKIRDLPVETKNWLENGKNVFGALWEGVGKSKEGKRLGFVDKVFGVEMISTGIELPIESPSGGKVCLAGVRVVPRGYIREQKKGPQLAKDDSKTRQRQSWKGVYPAYEDFSGRQISFPGAILPVIFDKGGEISLNEEAIGLVEKVSKGMKEIAMTMTIPAKDIKLSEKMVNKLEEDKGRFVAEMVIRRPKQKSRKRVFGETTDLFRGQTNSEGMTRIEINDFRKYGDDGVMIDLMYWIMGGKIGSHEVVLYNGNEETVGEILQHITYEMGTTISRNLVSIDNGSKKVGTLLIESMRKSRRFNREEMDIYEKTIKNLMSIWPAMYLKYVEEYYLNPMRHFLS